MGAAAAGWSDRRRLRRDERSAVASRCTGRSRCALGGRSARHRGLGKRPGIMSTALKVCVADCRRSCRDRRLGCGSGRDAGASKTRLTCGVAWPTEQRTGIACTKLRMLSAERRGTGNFVPVIAVRRRRIVGFPRVNTVAIDSVVLWRSVQLGRTLVRKAKIKKDALTGTRCSFGVEPGIWRRRRSNGKAP